MSAIVFLKKNNFLTNTLSLKPEDTMSQFDWINFH